MAPSSLPGSIVQSIAAANVNSVGMQPAALANLALGNLIQNINLSQQNAVSLQQLMNQLQMVTLGKAVNRLSSTPPAAAAAVSAARGRRERELLKLLVELLKHHKR